MSQEKWSPINEFKNHDYNGKYEVSNWGKVRNAKTQQEMKFYTKAKGSKYLKVRLYDRYGEGVNLYVHQLVAFHFIGQAPEGALEVDHIDGNAQNNSYTNLRYLSHKENMQALYAARQAV